MGCHICGNEISPERLEPWPWAKTCSMPSSDARRFEQMVVEKIRSNVLTETNIRALIKIVDERMDGVAREQRERLQTIEEELGEVKLRMDRIWHLI